MKSSPITQLSGVQWWLKKRSAYFLRNFILIFAIVGILAFAFSFLDLSTLKMSEILFLLLFGGGIVLFGIDQFVKWKQNKTITVTKYWYGTIIDAHMERNHKKKSRRYFITADVNGKTMEGSCLVQTYNLAQKGQQILLFTLSGDKVFCVHPEM